jgi:hypothetical protein
VVKSYSRLNISLFEIINKMYRIFRFKYIPKRNRIKDGVREQREEDMMKKGLMMEFSL